MNRRRWDIIACAGGLTDVIVLRFDPDQRLTMTQRNVKKKDLPVKRFRSQEAWEKWLKAEHERSQGIWLEFAKKASGRASVNYKEALEVALCYGWIDGQTAAVDETWYRQRFTPRRPRSKWSQINRVA
ncbi:MAG TPA: hypothetical protein VFD73_02420, partial [Gemmatimonadales bacterium]|nr:hypothetical protein [Gemmatimonadales bacterium]